MLEAMAFGLEAVAFGLEAVAFGLEAMAFEPLAVASVLEAVASVLEAVASVLEAIASALQKGNCYLFHATLAFPYYYTRPQILLPLRKSSSLSSQEHFAAPVCLYCP